jgi:3-dehydroquinate synthase
MVERVKVKLGERSYEILVGEHLLASAGEHIAPVLKTPRVIIVSDEKVARFHLHRLTSALERAGIIYRTVIISQGETAKSIPTFGALLETLLEEKPDRQTTLIALGGGVVGDVTGFAASVLLRGIDFIQVPTTLLAQIDSSVGGKTGINSRYGKNLIGSFHQPKLVLADVATLSTLHKRELMAGYGEMLKYGLINDAAFFKWLEKNGAALLAGDAALLTQAIVTSCKAKAKIVAADEKESGERALLNFGHTFGHALEAETGFSYTLLHGEAVAIGMMMAIRFSVKMGLCKPEDCERVAAHYEAVGLPSALPSLREPWDPEALMEHFTHDKKTRDGKLTFILSRGIGKAFIAQDVDKLLIKEFLAEACHGV